MKTLWQEPVLSGIIGHLGDVTVTPHRRTPKRRRDARLMFTYVPLRALTGVIVISFGALSSDGLGVAVEPVDQICAANVATATDSFDY